MEIIGHRGASGHAPENTLAAFRMAADLGARAIETDLQLTRDGRLVIMHDDTLQRTTSGRGAVTAKTFEELRRLDAGSWFPERILRKSRSARRFAGERVPSIEEVFELAAARDIGLYLEMKAPCAPEAAEAVVAAIRAAGAAARSTVICFDADVLKRVRAMDPAVAVGYLFSGRLRDAVARADEQRAVETDERRTRYRAAALDVLIEDTLAGRVHHRDRAVGGGDDNAIVADDRRTRNRAARRSLGREEPPRGAWIGAEVEIDPPGVCRIPARLRPRGFRQHRAAAEPALGRPAARAAPGEERGQGDCGANPSLHHWAEPIACRKPSSVVT